MQKHLALFFALIFLPVFLTGQYSAQPDSLLRKLAREKTDTGRVMLYYRIAHEYQFTDLEKSAEFAAKALTEAERLKFKRGKGNALIQMGNIEQLKGNNQKAEEYNRQALEILSGLDDKAGISVAYNNLGILAHNRNDFETALHYYSSSLEISRKIGRKKGEATSLYSIGTLFENMSESDSALVYYISGLRISEEINEPRLIAFGKVSLAGIFFKMEDYVKALEYYIDVIRFYEKSGNNYGLMKTYLAVGQIYNRLDSTRQAIWYYRQVINTAQSIQSPWDAGNAYFSIGELYENNYKTDSALINYRAASQIFRETGNNENYALSLIALARIDNLLKRHSHARDLLEEAINIASGNRLSQVLIDANREMAFTWSKLGQFEKAFNYMTRYSEIKDSLMTVEKQKQILELQTRFETERKEKENELLKKDRQILRTTRNSLVAGVFLLLTIALLIFRSLAIKKRDNRILKMQKEEIREQKELVEKQKTEITDSIRYARRIQAAILPPPELFSSVVPDSFVLYLPKDIVSGDFYYLRQISESMVLVCAADCTGHGVPGAFMSMLGMSLLNDIVNPRLAMIAGKTYTPAMILNDLRDRIKQALRQTGKEGEARDGMDLSLCIIEKDICTIHFSGANNPLYYVTNGVLSELKATRNPVGIYLNEIPFTGISVSIEKGSVIYLFSDGYSDQIGEGGKKFLSRNLKSVLSEISAKPMDEIKEELHRRHLEWRGKEEQVDDILIIGVRI